MGKTGTDCPQTWKPVQFKKLLDGVEVMEDTRGKNAKYGDITVNAENGSMVFMGDINDVDEIRAMHDTVTPEPEHTEPTSVDKSTIRNQNADTRLKTLWFLITLLILCTAAYLLAIKNMTLQELLEPFLGNLPG